MTREFRVRLLADRPGCDGESSWWIPKGMLGTASSVNHPKDKLHGDPRTVHVWWDYALYDSDDDRDDHIYTDIEDDVPIDQLAFVEINEKP